MSAHTPGPWRVEWTTARNASIQAGEESCIADAWWINIPEQEGRANAQLITAAPELLEAAKLVLAWYEVEENHGDTSFMDRVEMCRQSENAIRAALAKATTL